MICKTMNYDLFKFRKDNRKQSGGNGLINDWVDEIAKWLMKDPESLRYKPVLVNKDMEIIDGQHRVAAAKKVGVPIYYQVKEDFTAEDILKFNKQKQWNISDVFNYYVENGYPEYMQLHRFIENKKISLHFALNMALAKHERDKFRDGLYKFDYDKIEADYDSIKTTCELIHSLTRSSQVVQSAKFWRALSKLFRQPGFCVNSWLSNIRKRIQCFTPKARERDYIHLVLEVYNYGAKTRRRITEKDMS